MPSWVDTHCHLDAPAFAADRDAMRARARTAGVGLCVMPAVAPSNFDAVRALAHRWHDAYAVGIHPMAVPEVDDRALQRLADFLQAHGGDPHLVAVGEIGLDYFVPELQAGALRDRQERIYREQLRLAREHGLPVLLHVRRSVDRVLQGLRQVQGVTGIAHAFNGSRQQADQFLELGFKLGFGGAVTFERATRLRRLAAELPGGAIVMETDAPDIPPHWLYRTAAERAAGAQQGRNEPTEVPRIGALVAGLRGMPPAQWARATRANALAALPRLRGVPMPTA